VFLILTRFQPGALARKILLNRFQRFLRLPLAYEEFVLSNSGKPLKTVFETGRILDHPADAGANKAILNNRF